jgi:hypothetical protein
VENRNHHKRDDSVWQEDRHRHRRPRIAQYQQSPQLTIKLILHDRPQIKTFKPNAPPLKTKED